MTTLDTRVTPRISLQRTRIELTQPRLPFARQSSARESFARLPSARESSAGESLARQSLARQSLERQTPLRLGTEPIRATRERAEPWFRRRRTSLFFELAGVGAIMLTFVAAVLRV